MRASFVVELHELLNDMATDLAQLAADHYTYTYYIYNNTYNNI